MAMPSSSVALVVAIVIIGLTICHARILYLDVLHREKLLGRGWAMTLRCGRRLLRLRQVISRYSLAVCWKLIGYGRLLRGRTTLYRSTILVD